MSLDLDKDVTFCLSVLELDDSKIEHLTEQLVKSKGLNATFTDTFRPYYVIARELLLDTTNNVIKAEGAEFGQNQELARRYLLMQSMDDVSLDILPQYSCDFLLRSLPPTVTTVEPDSIGIGFMSF
jgi:hypothetical protein